MKILTITLKNLNSLRGTWHIDLTQPDYTSGGIFAVTGPTGAGKTTIFDAVCLALYSQTSRLGNIGGQSNEIMTRRTNECSAKVKFESHGRKYICEWEQHRVRGKLQTARHEVSYADTGEIICSSKGNTAGVVAKITGMDFSRFRQSMLLEQGRFDRFLSADKNSKAAILELITGSAIYSEISREVYSRKQKESQKLAMQESTIGKENLRLGGMTEESIRGDLAIADEEISRAESACKSSKEILDWQNDIDELSRRIDAVRSEILSHEERVKNFSAERGVLEAAERARSIDGEYSALAAKRSERNNVGVALSGMNAKIAAQESECRKISAGLPELNGELSRLTGGISKPNAAVVARIESAVRDYESCRKDVAVAEKALTTAEQECRKKSAILARIESDGKSLSAKKDALQRKYSELHGRFMDMDASTREAVLDEARGMLLDGEECPVCGSRTHPRKDCKKGGENPDVLFEAKKKLNDECKRADEAFRAADKKLSAERDKWSNASAEKIAAYKLHAQCIEELSTKKEKLSAAKIALTEIIHTIGLSWSDDTGEILRMSREWSARIDALTERIQASQQELSNLQAVIMSGREQADTKRTELDAISSELVALEAKFTESLTRNNFADEASFIASRKTQAEIETMRKKMDELSSQSERLQGMLQTLQNDYDSKTAMNLSDKLRAEIQSQYQQENSRLTELHQRKGSLTQSLKTVQEITAHIAELATEYERQKATCQNWDELCGLIGSASGDKYNIFAQKVTLSLVVNNANDYLHKMNGRYTIMLTPENDKLELSVKDSEQAGEIRPTSNLSGGERFIISLALALGLSQISGSKAQVDSLFIDEGFGSLDDDSLSAALEALGEIRRDGRMIGIISHIQGISERIPTKINVIPKTEGTSIITGPGCSGGI